jgi:hypothetical protein
MDMDSERHPNPIYHGDVIYAAALLGYSIGIDHELEEFAAALVTIGKHGAAAEVLAELNA